VPNDHGRFDYGAIWFGDHLRVVDAQSGTAGHRICVAPSNRVALKHVPYYQGLWQGEQARSRRQVSGRLTLAHGAGDHPSRGRRWVGWRVVQAALKLVLEPIWEADLLPCSYGFRPGRRAQDAIAEVHYLASRSYEWVVEGDIEACFDTIDHAA
jgi:hypothetical protein